MPYWRMAIDPGLPPGSIDPVWRPPFAGRRSQLAHLAAEYERAEEGGIRITLIAGEPGIGKSRLISEFMAGLEATGAAVLFGRCDQDGLIPYQPIVEALRDHFSGEGGDAAMAELGAEWLELRRLLPGDGHHPVNSESSALSHSSQRYRLFESVVTLLSMNSRERPVVLVLEDLHWADAPLTALVRHLVRSRRLQRVQIVATYRESDIDDDHPLHDLLADIGHGDKFTMIALGGLGTEELVELFDSVVAGSTPVERDEYLRQVFERTGGNPFFVLEMFRHLGDSRPGTQSGPGVPGGVRELVAARMKTLPPAVREVLSVAAVIGHHFDFTVLQRALGVSGAELLDLLAVAARAGYIVESETAPGAEFRFTHIISRDAVYETLPPGERAGIHHRIGEALETIGHGESAHVPELLAYHFERSTHPADIERTVRYARTAGERALNALAFEDAVTFFQAALRAQERSSPATALERCELLLCLGRALSGVEGRVAGTDREHALATFAAAAALARELDSPKLMVEAALGGGGHWLEGAGGYGASEQKLLRLNEDVLSWLPAHPSPERLRLLGSLRALYAAAVKPRERRRCSDEIQHIAAALGTPEALLQARLESAIEAWEGCQYAEAVAGFDLCLADAHGWERPEILSKAHFLRTLSLARLGNLAATREAVRRLGEFAQDSRDPVLRLYADCFFPGGFAHMRGDIQGALAHVARGAVEAGEVGSRHASGARFVQLFHLRAFMGEREALRMMWPHWLRGGSAQQRSAVAWSAAHLGDFDTANEQLDRLASGELSIPDDRMRMIVLSHFGEAAALAGRTELAERLCDDLLGFEGLMFDCGVLQFVVGPVGRPLGMLASLLQRWEAADAHFEAAIRAAKDMEHRPAVADTTFQHARSLVARNQWSERGRAREMAEFAEAEAREMGYVPLLRQTGLLLDGMGRGGYPAGLSEREVDVLRLAARGLTTREIADELVLSQPTVATHLRHIFDKTGSANRAQAVAFASRHGLT